MKRQFNLLSKMLKIYKLYISKLTFLWIKIRKWSKLSSSLVEDDSLCMTEWVTVMCHAELWTTFRKLNQSNKGFQTFPIFNNPGPSLWRRKHDLTDLMKSFTERRELSVLTSWICLVVNQIEAPVQFYPSTGELDYDRDSSPSKWRVHL